MITEQLTQDQLIAMLAWQVEMGADEAVLDKPSNVICKTCYYCMIFLRSARHHLPVNSLIEYRHNL